MRSTSLLTALVTSLCIFTSLNVLATPPPSDAAWVNLFNGKDLSGWTAKITGHALGENVGRTFRVEDGLLQVRYDQYDNFAGQFGHLFYREPFSHYALTITYRFVGEQVKGGPRGWAVRNSGVMLHAQAPTDMTLTQDFPDSIEAQFLGGLSNGRARPTANVCTPGTHIVVDNTLYKTHCLNSASATFDGDDWVTVTVVVLGGGSITHYVNGKQVLKYHQPQFDRSANGNKDGHDAPSQLGSGFIALQSESHPIDFKSIKILNLAGCTDRSAQNYQAYAVKSIPTACRYADS